MTKWNAIIGSVDANSVVLVFDLILIPTTPPKKQKKNHFEALKQRLILEFSVS